MEGFTEEVIFKLLQEFSRLARERKAFQTEK